MVSINLIFYRFAVCLTYPGSTIRPNYFIGTLLGRFIVQLPVTEMNSTLGRENLFIYTDYIKCNKNDHGSFDKEHVNKESMSDSFTKSFASNLDMELLELFLATLKIIL